MKRVEWFWSLLWCVAVSSQPRGQPIVVISLSLLIIDYHLLSFPQFPPFFFSLPTLSHRHQFKQTRDNPLRHFIECVFVQASKRRWRIRKTMWQFLDKQMKRIIEISVQTLWMAARACAALPSGLFPRPRNKRKLLLDQCLPKFCAQRSHISRLLFGLSNHGLLISSPGQNPRFFVLNALLY